MQYTLDLEDQTAIIHSCFLGAQGSGPTIASLAVSCNWGSFKGVWDSFAGVWGSFQGGWG